MRKKNNNFFTVVKWLLWTINSANVSIFGILCTYAAWKLILHNPSDSACLESACTLSVISIFCIPC